MPASRRSSNLMLAAVNGVPLMTGQPGQLVGGESLPHAPAAAVPVIVRPVGVGRCVGTNLEEHFSVTELGGPGAVDVGRLSGHRHADRGLQEQDEESGEVAHVRFDGHEAAGRLSTKHG